MVYIVTALYCEATPLIKHYNLKKLPPSSKFEIYGNEDFNLIISGTGMFKSAVAATHLFSVSPPVSGSIAVNTGICGALNPDFHEGKMFIINKVTNNLTGKSYYPDMLLRHGLSEGSLETFPSPVVKESAGSISSQLVDMEAAGFMEAATAFFPSHNIYCLKVVSDHLEGNRLTTSHVSRLISINLPYMDKLFQNASSIARTDNAALTDEELEMLDTISNNLKLSVTMKHQLKSLAVHYKLSCKKSLDSLDAFKSTAANTREERKKQFESIRKLLTS
jgi:hypothetical protein